MKGNVLLYKLLLTEIERFKGRIFKGSKLQRERGKKPGCEMGRK